MTRVLPDRRASTIERASAAVPALRGDLLITSMLAAADAQPATAPQVQDAHVPRAEARLGRLFEAAQAAAPRRAGRRKGDKLGASAMFASAEVFTSMPAEPDSLTVE